MQWISAAIILSKLAQRVLELIIHFCTECVDSAILLLLTVINTNITMVISKNQLSLRDTQKHCIAISGHDLVTSLHVKKSKYCFIVTFSRLPLSNQAYDVLKS